MAPSKARAAPPDDSRSEASSTREKLGSSGQTTTTGKGRRVATGATASSSLRDVTTAGSIASGTTGPSNGLNQEVNVGVSTAHTRG